MTFAEQKIELAQKLLQSTDRKLIKKLQAILEEYEGDEWWDALPEEVKKSIKVSEEQFAKGEYIAHDEVMKKYQKWVKK
jgi:predicted transcriptional regulator